MPAESNSAGARLAQLFAAALEKESAEERRHFLAEACGADVGLRSRVEALLRAHQRADKFLDHNVHGEDIDLDDEGVGAMVGPYRLLERLGMGGFGVVYRAEQMKLIHREVALKIIKLGMDTRAVVARFEAERQALALMAHPNIAKVLDAGATETGRPYFVMELVQGVPITDYCDQACLSTTERLQLFMQVCYAIQHAHQKGIIHRDLKPSNILVTVQDGVPVPKVIDFGIAKATGGQVLTEKPAQTAWDQFLGTPAYTSPEQAQTGGVDLDTRSDIYNLGVLLYELLTGKTPFEHKQLVEAGLDEMRRIIREQEPPRPSTRLSTLTAPEQTTVAKRRSSEPPQLIDQLRGDLDWIVMKSLEKDRSLRYDTANGLAADVQRFMKSEPVLARPRSFGYYARKFVRRNRVVVAAAAMILLALLLGALGSTWEAIRARKAEREAQSAQSNEAQQRRRAEAQAYVANMNAAQAAWDMNNVGRLRELLQETANYPERGFEWYYWHRQLHLDLKTLRGHTGAVKSVAFSPDGGRIITGSADHTAKIWDMASGEALLTLQGHSGSVNAACFSPDGVQLLTASGDGTARVWDAAHGKELLILKGPTNGILSAAFSSDGRRIVTGAQDGSARVWDASSGKELLSLKARNEVLWSVAFAPDGQRILVGCQDVSMHQYLRFEAFSARLWDVSSGKQLLSFRAGNGDTTCAAFSPDGQRVVACDSDMTAKVWGSVNGNELTILKGHYNHVQSVAFSPDGRRIATGSMDQTAKVWDAATGSELLTLKGHDSWVAAVAFSPDGQLLVTGSRDGTAKVWDAARQREVLVFKGHTNALMAAAFSPDGRRVVTGGADSVAKLWDAASGQELLTLKGHTGSLLFASFFPDGRRLLTGSVDGTTRVWDAANGHELCTLGDTNCIATALSPDGLRIVTRGWDNNARVWDVGTGKELLTLRGHTAWIDGAAFSPNGLRIVTGSRDASANLWDAVTGKLLFTLVRHPWPVDAVFSPDSRRIITGSSGESCKIWETATGTELLSFKGHSGWITRIAFSPDGQRIVTCSSDQQAKLWQASNGKELLTLKGHTGALWALAFSPDGRRIVTGGLDTTARVWEAATPQQVAEWQRQEAGARSQ